MHTRRDQVEAHSFVANRMRAAMLRAEPDVARTPLRRTPVGLLVGVLLAAVGLGIAALVGVLRPTGGSGWQAEGKLIVEKGTGSRYVLVAGRLHPVLNYASARLLLGPQLQVVEAPADLLDDYPLGSQVGIPWAPDSLPPAAVAADQHWLACAGTDAATQRPTVTLTLDSGTVAAEGAVRNGVLVRDVAGSEYLISGGQRMKITAEWVARALGSETIDPPRVRSTLLDLLPAGPDLGSLPIVGRGSAGPTLAGQPTRIGEIVTAVAGRRPYLVVSTGLIPLTPMAATLALGDPRTAAAYADGAVRPVALGTAALAAASIVPAPTWLADLPALPTLLATDADHVPCVRIDSTPTSFRSSVIVAAPARVRGQAPSTVGLRVDADTADQVSIPAGGGALARVTAVAGAQVGGLVLITEDGGKYPVAGDDAAAALGYSPDSAVPVPPAVLALLPTGPTLTALGGGA